MCAMKRVLATFAMTFVFGCSALACEFKYDPIAAPQYIREQGWELPGIHGSREAQTGSVSPPMLGLQVIPGAIPRLIAHDSPYVVRLPAQVFTLNAKQFRMRPILAKVSIVRWEINNEVIAYTYSMIPVSAKKNKGKWIIKAEAGCIFNGTFIDDRGDGRFRVLVPGPLTPDLVPDWVMRERS